MSMPIAAMAASYSIAADICQPRRARDAQASAMTPIRQIEVRRRLRRGAAAGAQRKSGTLPRERRVLTVVGADRSSHFKPSALTWLFDARCEREAVGRRMAGVVELQRFRRRRVDAHRPRRRHVDERGGRHRPARTRAVERDRRGLHAEEGADQADSAAIGPPAAPLAMAVMASRCSALARSSATRPTDQLPLPIAPGVKPEDDEAEPVERRRPVAARARSGRPWRTCTSPCSAPRPSVPGGRDRRSRSCRSRSTAR